MSYGNNHQYDKDALLAEFIGRDFLRLARELRLIQDQKPDSFTSVVKKLGLGRRKGYALARIARIFDELNVPDDRLAKIGWAKLYRLCSLIDQDNAEALLDLAETHTAYALDRILRGETPVAGAKVIVLYISEKDNADLEKLLLKYGATRTSAGGLRHREEALMLALQPQIQSADLPTDP